MGIFLGQLPPAELARLKAELAETLIANFCYPRFFDYRTESLRMRPVDRAKRQEVWLYLSSVDFTTWNRVDVMSPDFQRQLERLFIQFVQRNRSFFGEQGRKRMSDVRMLINSSASTVTQSLRTHIAGQRPTGTAPFGSPRPVISWSTKSAQSKQDASWEKIAAATMLLQQQLLEVRASNGSANGEIKTAPPNDGRAAMPGIDIPPSNGTPRRIVRPHSGAKQEPGNVPSAPAAPITSQPTPISHTAGTARPAAPQSEPKPSAMPAQTAPAASAAPVQPTFAPTVSTPKPNEVASPVAGSRPANATPPSTSTPTAPSTPQGMPASYQMATSRSAQQATPIEHVNTAVSPIARATTARDARTQAPAQSPMAKVAPPAATPPAMAPTPPPTPPVTPLAPMTANRSMMAPSSASATNIAPAQRDNSLMRVGDDDIAIFEQMRHQMLVWLRIEVIRAGLELANQTPSQLLELLRRQDHMDETRLQVVSTLLNLANQVITNGQVSVLDYKQALMFHLMHTRR